ncbi:MAG: hypothetical protein EAZ16_03010 [Sphingobacteriales bacterium]|jgi:hypothetical protein|nr:MAG: hypothetical protein EAZ16_03010 [Sphingobacteriales bacterium]
MKKIFLCLEFKGGKGHCYVTILMSDYHIVKFDESECYEYLLPTGSYDILCDGVCPSMSTTITITDENETVLAKRRITREGNFSKIIQITL